MPRLREHLGLEDAAHNATWRELKASDFIEKMIKSHVNLSKYPMPHPSNTKSIEHVTRKVCRKFEGLFSNPSIETNSRKLLRRQLNQYVMDFGTTLRDRRKLSREKVIARRHCDDEEARGASPPYSLTPRPIHQTNPQTDVANLIDAYFADQRIPIHSGVEANIPNHHPEIEVKVEATNVDHVVSSPPPSQDSLWYPPLPSGSHHDQDEDLSHTVSTDQEFYPDAVPDVEDEPAPIHNELSAGMNHDELHDFLASCRPRLTHLYPYLVAYGCTDMDYLKVMSEWSEGDLHDVLENMKAIKAVDAEPGKPMDWHVLRHFIRKLKGQ